jgi:hypothetical protein
MTSPTEVHMPLYVGTIANQKPEPRYSCEICAATKRYQSEPWEAMDKPLCDDCLEENAVNAAEEEYTPSAMDFDAVRS